VCVACRMSADMLLIIDYNLRKYSFCSRVVSIWNSLPHSVVDADTPNTFKSRLDKHWLDQDVLYSFHSELTGTGVLQFVCDVVKDTGKEEYLRPCIRIGLDVRLRCERTQVGIPPRTTVLLARSAGSTL